MITDLFMQQLVAGGRSKQRQSHVHPHQHARRRPLRGNGSRVCSTNRRMKFVKSTMNNCFWSSYDVREAFFHWPGDRKGEPSFSLNRCHVGRRASPHGNLRLPPSLAGRPRGPIPLPPPGMPAQWLAENRPRHAVQWTEGSWCRAGDAQATGSAAAGAPCAAFACHAAEAWRNSALQLI